MLSLVMLKATYQKYTLNFKFDAGTSRGTLKEKDTWFIVVWEDKNSDIRGIGEAGPLKKLSIDDIEDFDSKLEGVLNKLEGESLPNTDQEIYDLVSRLVPQELPSVTFGLETALLDLLHGGVRKMFSNPFFETSEQIPINGLIWMGHTESMLRQISDKVAASFDCIKMKIGSLNFDKECDILDFVRRKYFQKELILRVDANGAFKPEDALTKLNQLSKFNLHSIEQPIKPGQGELMKQLCSTSPVPIALDEELIGIHDPNEKRSLLEAILPQYIILKPTLVGGLKASLDWIRIAEELNIGWWITSALESNIGLNAICQFASLTRAKGHQGLGTGQLYTNNIGSPLTIDKGYIHYNDQSNWNLDSVNL
ncbi:MAG: o-succinylbenzoate synthase [Bacteroidota bacterium]